MRGKFFLLNTTAFIFFLSEKFFCEVLHRFFKILFPSFLAVIFISTNAQAQPVAGIRANGTITNQGNVLTVCTGTTVIYESTAQNYNSIKWRFNNGFPNNGNGNSTYQSISYSTAGTDTTWQVVSDGTDKDSVFILVRVTNVKPVSAFSFSPNGECGNMPVNFTNSSTGSGLTYTWNFGDGGLSTAANPAYQFLNATGVTGTQDYTVKLITTNDLSCSDSVTKTVTVKKIPDASLGSTDPTVSYLLFNGNPTFKKCENIPGYVFQFRNISTTNSIHTGYTIKWGDNSPDSIFASLPTSAIIQHAYSLGQHQLTLTITGSNGCIGIKKYNIFLGTNPGGGIQSLGNTSICAPNSLKFVINGYNNNVSGTTYKVSVNDGTAPVSFTNPPPDTVSHLFTAGSCGNNSSNGSNTYSNSYRVTLDVENPCGSTSGTVIPIYVSGKPKANISVYPSNTICTNYQLYLGNSSDFGGTIAQLGSGNSICSNTGQQVWTISPATGYTKTSGSYGSLNNAPDNSLIWDNGSSYMYVKFTVPGTYTIKLYVGNNLCWVDSVVKTICVRNPPKASFTMDKHTGCGPDTAVITNTSPPGDCLDNNFSWNISYTDVQNCGNSSSYTFINSTDANSANPVIRFASPGRYIVSLTVAANGTSFTCSPDTYRDTFWVKGPPKGNFNPINAVCAGNSVAPAATVSNCYSSNPVVYSWAFANGTPSSSTQAVPGNISYSTAGTYPVSLSLSNECGVTNISDNVIITSTPTVQAGQDAAICSNVPAQIGSISSPGLSYQWSPATGLSNPAIANPIVTLNYTGANNDTSYAYVVTASAGAKCSATDTVIVTVKKNPVVTVIPVAVAVCAGSGTQLVASGADSYLWDPISGLDKNTGNTVIATPAATTTYTVTGTSANGCSATANTTVSVIAFAVVSAGPDTVVCNYNTSIALTGTPAGGTWGGSAFINSAGVFNPSLAGNGNYTVKYTAGNGNCTSSDSAVIMVIDAPVADAGNDTTVCLDTSIIQLNGSPTGGRWSGSSFVSPTGQFSPSASGTYPLIYTIGGGTCIGNDTIIVNVAGGITNNTISANQNICYGTSATVINGAIATGGNGTVVYQWQSGRDNIAWTDITGETGKNYLPGTLTQTTFFRRIASTILCSGPQANASNVVTISVNPDAKAVFTPMATSGCVPFVITPSVINLTTDSSVSEYRWFVNGSYIGSGENFPGYTMNNSGDSITIKLIAVSRFGCKNDSAQNGFVTVERPAPSFTKDTATGCGPLTVTFTNTTPNAGRYTFLWDFGQGQASALEQPGSVLFPTNPANSDTVYIVTMKVISSCDTISKKDSVKVKSKPKALFTPDRSEGCSPMKVTFSNTSRGVNAIYSWNFGDGSTPVATNNATVQHTFTTGVTNTFYVKLKGANDCGTDSLVYAIVVNPNSIRLDFAVNGNERSGCAPQTVHFINNTTGANSFSWNFGDSTTLVTSKGIDTVAHTYTTAGNFTIHLLAANACNDTTDTEMVAVALKPGVSFTANPLTACVTDTIHFINTSDPGIVSTWNFGDASSSSVRNPVKSYQQPGNYRVLLTGSNVLPQGLTCSDSAYVTIIIRDTLRGNIIVSDSVGSCTPFTVTFKNANGPSPKTTWDFGDGSAAGGDSISHTYTAPGIYNVVMISNGVGGCIYKSIQSVKVTAPVGTLNYSGGFVCANTAVKFEVRASNTDSYTFIFGDGDSVVSTNPIVFHQYLQPGRFVPYANLVSGNCSIKVFTGDSIKADNIHAGFNIAANYSCGLTGVQFTDTSSAYFGLKNHNWTFGDGTSSSVSNPVKTFTQSGLFYVHLSVTGNSGCTDTLTVPVNITIRNYPVSSILVDSVGCTGQPLNANAIVSSQDSIVRYSWNFGNNSTGSGQSTAPVYNSKGMYTIGLITSTIYGCSDTVYKKVSINTSPVVTAGPDVRICQGQTVQLQASGANTWQWSPLQSLSCVACANPLANPSATTQYFVQGTNSAGCTVTDTVLVNVVQPVQVTVSANDTICIGGQTQLFANGAANYSWSPALGLSSSSVPNPVANPGFTTQYQVTGSDAYNCFSSTANVTVAVGNYPTVELNTGTLVVAGTQVILNPVLTNGPFLSYAWTPAQDLSCNNCPNPVATINNNITYSLEVKNIYGCGASDTIRYTVKCEEASQLFVPNAFSPDNDGLNDVLMIRGKGIATVRYFRIFNRWGQMVFERNNFNANQASEGWDGKINGHFANPDVYVYTAEVICTAGGVFSKKGNVTLFR